MGGLSALENVHGLGEPDNFQRFFCKDLTELSCREINDVVPED